MIEKNSKRLCPGALGISFGVVTGLFMLFMAWAGYFWGHGLVLISEWSNFYPGYSATITGGLIGFLWGLLEGFVTGFIIAWIYNMVTCCCKCKICKSSCTVETNKPTLS